MTIKSMTGFARTEGGSGTTSWIWELRTVNGRGLELRLRLPPGYEALEPRIRELAKGHFVRGNVSLNLNVRREEGGGEFRLNEAVLQQVLKAMETIGRHVNVAPPRAEQLLAIRGVFEVSEGEASGADAEARVGAIMASLTTALKAAVAMRCGEGARLKALIAGQIDDIERLVAAVEAAPARQPDAIRARFKEQVARLMDAGPNLDEARLHQEAAMLATKLDVEEELKRLTAHIGAARELLNSGEPVGRKLDFLTQEFNREANTLCSKSNDSAITASGLELKAVIDQMREQVQNIE